MRSIALATVLILAAATASMAQESSGGDAALSYHWVRSNTPPGDCGCFGLNGGSVSGSWNLNGHWSAVAEIGAEHAGNVLSTGGSLTLTSYLGGARYRLPQPWRERAHAPQPFAQVLLGATHAGGTIAGSGDGAYAFATRIGGGVDVPLNAHFAVRVVQIDYYLTKALNATNDHQNNLLLGAGIVFHWSR
jgi:hypothetical protein